MFCPSSNLWFYVSWGQKSRRSWCELSGSFSLGQLVLWSRAENKTLQDEWERSGPLLAPAAVHWGAQSKGMEECFLLCTMGSVSSLVSFRGCRLELLVPGASRKEKEGATLSFGKTLNFSKFRDGESESQRLLQGEKDNKRALCPPPQPLSSFCGHWSSSSFKLILMGYSIHILLTRSEEWVETSNQGPRTGLLSLNT